MIGLEDHPPDCVLSLQLKICNMLTLVRILAVAALVSAGPSDHKGSSDHLDSYFVRNMSWLIVVIVLGSFLLITIIVLACCCCCVRSAVEQQPIIYPVPQGGIRIVYT